MIGIDRRAIISIAMRSDFRAGANWMAGLGSLVGRFPRHELEIHRLYVRNSDFGEVCDDLLVTISALNNWEAAREPSDPRVMEYRHLVEELEAEMAHFFSGERNNTR